MRHGAPEEAHNEIAQDNSMARNESWGIFSSVNIRDDQALQIGPSHGDPERHSSLVNALGVVRYPGDGVGDARIDAHRRQESGSELDMRRMSSEQHGKPNDPQWCDADCAETSSTGFVTDVTHNDRQNGCRSKRRDGEELGFGCVIAKFGNDLKVLIS